MPEIKCEHCGKVFDNDMSLKQHVNDKHVEKPVDEKPAGPTVSVPAPKASAPQNKVTMKVSKKAVIAVVAVVALAAVGYFAYTFLPSLIPGEAQQNNTTSMTAPIGPLGSIHSHADFAVFLDGQQITPLPEEYFVRNRFVHVEVGPGAGSVIHMHATNVPLSFFFRSLGMTFTNECFTLDNGREFCNEGNKTLKMFVQHRGGEWEENRQFQTYSFQDLDRILITYGDETPDEIEAQENQVTDLAVQNSDRQMDLGGIPA